MRKSTQFAILFACAFVAIANAATVYQTAQDAGLTTLVAAIDAAGYKSLLNNPNFQGTVFAPTNEAFSKLIAALGTTPEKLLKDKKLLQNVLNYHIIPDDLLTKKSLAEIQNWGTNLADKEITIYKSPYTSKLRVYYGNQKANKDNIAYEGSADVIKADIKADHAIVQVINAVLIPPTQKN